MEKRREKRGRQYACLGAGKRQKGRNNPLRRHSLLILLTTIILFLSVIGIFPFSGQLSGYDQDVWADAVNLTNNSILITYIASYNEAGDNYTEKFRHYYWDMHYFVAGYGNSSGFLLTDHAENRCYINFSDIGTFSLMRSNGTLYVVNRTFSPGNYSYTVICNSTGIYNTTKANESFEVLGNQVDIFSETYFDDIGSMPAAAWADYDNDDDLWIDPEKPYFDNFDCKLRGSNVGLSLRTKLLGIFVSKYWLEMSNVFS